jgi:23S rRNA (cytidine2498-2'-O)-methyltransferase
MSPAPLRLPADLRSEGWVGYQAPPGHEERLIADLGDQGQWFGPLYLVPGGYRPCPWAANVWLEPELLPIRSVGDAAKQLRAKQRSWWPLSVSSHRRLALITEALPHVSAKPLRFGEAARRSPLGAFTLIDEGLLLASARCSSPFPNGDLHLVEDREGPPSRAYLKLWEALTRLGRAPTAGETCLELGACPGGWTWVLLGGGAEVTAVDRSHLDRLMGHPRLEFVQGDAFALHPDRCPRAWDWLFSDVICYPERLYEFVTAWIASGRVSNFVCTLKFQGDDHYGVIRDFAAIPGGHVLHLSHNKHELTWMRLDPAVEPLGALPASR